MPDYKESVTCPIPPATGETGGPPSEANMDVSETQPDVMCPGKKAKYECTAGGINVRSDITTLSTIEVPCKNDKTYHEPNPWPTCVDKLDCLAPSVDANEITHDWTIDKGLTPPFAIK